MFFLVLLEYYVYKKNSLQPNQILKHNIKTLINPKILKSATGTIKTHLPKGKKMNNIILARQYQHMATDTHIVLMLAIPSLFSTKDFLRFVYSFPHPMPVHHPSPLKQKFRALY